MDNRVLLEIRLNLDGDTTTLSNKQSLYSSSYLPSSLVVLFPEEAAQILVFYFPISSKKLEV
jgi:hypothetical protein